MLSTPTRILDGNDDRLKDVTVLPFDASCAEEFGKLRGALKRIGVTVNPIDLQIAAVSLVHSLTLVTNNTKDFHHISGLSLEDWLSS